MNMDLQFFVPCRFFIGQMLFFLIGYCCLAKSAARWPHVVSIAAAYPVGAALMGLVQWIAFLFGKAHHTLWFCGFVGLVVVLWYLVKKPPNDSAYPRVSWSGSLWLLLVLCVAATMMGFLIMQSSDLSESDPRWQWAYHAKIIATGEGYNDAAFQDSSLLHINAKYPLAFSSIVGLSMRMSGGDGVVFRVVSFFFFLSFLLLLFAYAAVYRNPVGGIVALLVFGASSKLWALAVDESYVDFPLGVFALAWLMLVMTVWRRHVNWQTVCIVAGVVGSKMEGVVLIGILGFMTFRWGWNRHDRIHAFWLAGIGGVGVAVGLMCYVAGLNQLPATAVMENVQFSDVAFLGEFHKYVARIWPTLTAFLWRYSINSAFGLFFPIAFLASFAARGPFRGVVSRTVVGYICVMMLPFLVSPYINVEDHLKVVVSRLLCQVVPLLCVLIAEATPHILSPVQVYWQRFSQLRTTRGADGWSLQKDVNVEKSFWAC